MPFMSSWDAPEVECSPRLAASRVTILADLALLAVGKAQKDTVALLDAGDVGANFQNNARAFVSCYARKGRRECTILDEEVCGSGALLVFSWVCSAAGA